MLIRLQGASMVSYLFVWGHWRNAAAGPTDKQDGAIYFFRGPPVITYDWEADSDEAWTVPLGVRVAKTVIIGDKPWKFQFQVQKFVVQPDVFRTDWLVKFTVTPVVSNVFASWSK